MESIALPNSVLCVDDDPQVLSALTRTLRGQPFDLVTCADGEEALDLLRTRPVAVVLADKNMPRMSGIELLTLTRREFPDVLRILMTGDGELTDAIAAINKAEVHRYLTKPWNNKDLVQLVQDSIKQHERAVEHTREEHALVLEKRRLDQQLENLRSQVTHDPLTGLYNRGEFDTRLKEYEARSRRDHIPYSLAIGDLDNFKNVNDLYGHPVGDSVLRNVAKQLQAALRDYSDGIFRYGGEEFAILLHKCPVDGGWIAMNRALDRIRQYPILAGDTPLTVTMSIGLAVSDETFSGEELLVRADTALYQAKRNGKDQVQIASPID